MPNKKVIIIEITLIIIIIIGTLIFKYIPQYKKTLGSSDTSINLETYEDIVEIKISDLDFALITTNNIITNILFFDKQSLCLYNQNIENSSLEESIRKIVVILNAKNYLQENSIITIINYNDISYTSVKDLLVTNIKDYPTSRIQEEKSTLKEKAKSLTISSEDDASILKELELYSKNIIRRMKYDVTENNPNNLQEEVITTSKAKNYTDKVYEKILLYQQNNNIVNESISNQTLPITQIPADNFGTIYPDETSWYYIENGKVYAYISITQNKNKYSYCYNESINNYKKGPC